MRNKINFLLDLTWSKKFDTGSVGMTIMEEFQVSHFHMSGDKIRVEVCDKETRDKLMDFLNSHGIKWSFEVNKFDENVAFVYFNASAEIYLDPGHHIEARVMKW